MKTETKEKRNTVDVHLQVVLQTVEHTAVRNQEGSQGQDHGLESSNPVHILMKKDADIDLAVALHMDPKENAVVVDRGAEENPIGLRDQDQRVEQEGMIVFIFSCLPSPQEKVIIK
ncbi:ras-related protein Rab-18-B-like [Platysternon megacephalum]|uniref:Ras-related protein Rab-18-B-like n=1 Tax=Platysternon megacephalum TaxID=55544 RepID=A0A4D9EKX0_9SAUR|nr:ras-related protein Rab-18-B-like [Platysternon megacephalum]